MLRAAHDTTIVMMTRVLAMDEEPRRPASSSCRRLTIPAMTQARTARRSRYFPTRGPAAARATDAKARDDGAAMSPYVRSERVMRPRFVDGLVDPHLHVDRHRGLPD